MFLTKKKPKAQTHFILSICSPNLPVRCAPSLRSFSFLKVYLIFIYMYVCICWCIYTGTSGCPGQQQRA